MKRIDELKQMKSIAKQTFDELNNDLDKEIKKEEDKNPILRLCRLINESHWTTIEAQQYEGCDAITLTQSHDRYKIVCAGSDVFDIIYEQGYRINFIGASSTPTEMQLFLTKI